MTEMVRQSLYGFETREFDTRRAPTQGDRVTYNIKQLWQRSHEIFGMALNGFKQKEIASTLGISQATVSNTLNSDLGIQKMAELRKARDGEYVDISKRVAELTDKALTTYNEIFDRTDVDIELKKKTADTVVLDIAGHRAATKIDSRSITMVATSEEIEKFKQRGLEAARAAGLLAEEPPKLETKSIDECLDEIIDIES